MNVELGYGGWGVYEFYVGLKREGKTVFRYLFLRGVFRYTLTLFTLFSTEFRWLTFLLI